MATRLTVLTTEDSPLAKMLEAMEEEAGAVAEDRWVEFLVCYLDRDAKVEPKDPHYTPRSVFVEVSRHDNPYPAQRVAEEMRKAGLMPVILVLDHSLYEFLYKDS